MNGVCRKNHGLTGADDYAVDRRDAATRNPPIQIIGLIPADPGDNRPCSVLVGRTCDALPIRHQIQRRGARENGQLVEEFLARIVDIAAIESRSASEEEVVMST
jgi:hypothetical protein